MKPFARLVLLIAALMVEAGCASGVGSVGETVRYLTSRNKAIEDTPLSPTQRYLRVFVDGRIALLVLGYVVPNKAGDIEVWYSAHGEVVKLQQGRIVGTAALTTDWREVRFDALPPWASVGDTPLHITREHDEMPGYRMGIRESLTLKAIDAPQRSDYLGDPNRLRWYEEHTELSGLPPSLYAIGIYGARETVVYGEQCLTKTLCLTWQRWPTEQR